MIKIPDDNEPQNFFTFFAKKLESDNVILVKSTPSITVMYTFDTLRSANIVIIEIVNIMKMHFYKTTSNNMYTYIIHTKLFLHRAGINVHPRSNNIVLFSYFICCIFACTSRRGRNKVDKVIFF